ncbi:MAG: ATP synthase F1 subunit gamma [Bacteroidales bacterium]|nr:ATP synthase F1 subunit gamma [Bacteroidales bacterium]
MPSLKEIKGRIATVRSTLKITSAMKMISWVKLRHAQSAIANLLPFQKALDEILYETTLGEESYYSPFFEKREIKKVGIIAISSNTTLCGAFNSNIINKTQSIIDQYKNMGVDEIKIYALGKVLAKHFSKLHYAVEILPSEMIEKPGYESSFKFANEIMDLFRNKELDRIDLVFSHFKSRASQVVTTAQYLPYHAYKGPSSGVTQKVQPNNYIFEPGREEIAIGLIEKSLKFKIFSVISDSSASEHAARTLAMQIATDNADNLIEELTLQYNKSRQQAITNELLDIMGGFR